MTGEVPTKPRFVRCPKCRHLLQELPNVPVYKCGGCGTVLQAKKRKVPPESAEQQVTESENISSDREAENFHQEETISLPGHLPEEMNCDISQIEIQIGNEDHPVDAESSPEISKKHMNSVSKAVDSTVGFSEELKRQGNVESNQEVDKDECVHKEAKSSSGFSKDLMHHGSSVSIQDVDIDECVSEDTLEREECLPKRIDRGDQKKSENSKEKLLRRISFSDEEDENEIFMELVNEANRRKSRTVVEANAKSDEDSDVAPSEPHNPNYVQIHRRVTSSDDLAYLTEFNHQNETFLELSNEANQRKSDEDFRSHGIFEISPEGEILEERVLNNDHISILSGASFYNHEHMSSEDTLDNIVALRDMPESPMTQSYYGFYGSGSSCDGTEKEFTNGKSLLRNGEVSHTRKVNRETQGQIGYFTSSLLGKSHQLRVPFYRRDQELGNYSNEDLGVNFHLPNKREFLEVEKMELLKKVRELEDQLKRTNLSQGKQNGNFSRFGENQSNFSQIPFSSEATTSSAIRIHTYNSEAIKLRAERLYLGQKHTLPVSGGAPFLLCYSCSEVLQVPADFLSFQRYHKLKCGNCSAILKYSLRNRTQIVYIDHISKDLDQTERVSMSFSTEEAPSPIENFSEKKISSSKKESKITNFVKNLGYVRSSSKRSKAESSASESEEVLASANSSLHRLMGYDSATILLKGDAGF